MCRSSTTLADALLISLSDSPDLGLTVPGKLASYMAAGKPVLASNERRRVRGSKRERRRACQPGL